MNHLNKILVATLAVASLCSLAAHADPKPDPLTFTGTVGAVAIEQNRHPGHSSLLVLTLLDANGHPITVCNRAQMPWILALAASDPRAAKLQQQLTDAKAAKTKVTVIASEDKTDSDGVYCGIKSLSEEH